MRRLPLTLLAASLMLAIGTAQAATPTTIPAAAVKTAEQLRDKAMNDNTGYQIVESLTTEVGPRLAGSPAANGPLPSSRRWALTRSIPSR
jgi:hypothetical protein